MNIGNTVWSTTIGQMFFTNDKTPLAFFIYLERVEVEKKNLKILFVLAYTELV